MFKKLALIIFCLSLVAAASGCSSNKQAVPGDDLNKNIVGNSTEPNNISSEQKNDARAALLEEIMQTARQGKIINCEFPVAIPVETVKAKWGEPDKSEYIAAAKGTYATYQKYNVAFGFNKGLQIFDVRSYDDRLKEITMSTVKKVLGTPQNTHHYDTEDMLVYEAGDKYQLLFIFPGDTQQNADPRLDHYNVFYPEGTVNSMANDPGIKY